MLKLQEERAHCTTRIANGSKMFDQLIGLILAILALVYLVYAMLRPERF